MSDPEEYRRADLPPGHRLRRRQTPGLTAFRHAARGTQGVPHPPGSIDPAVLPKAGVRLAAFDGENADAANGRAMSNGILAYTPWGRDRANGFAGKAGYERVCRNDEHLSAPGAETARELFANEPTLILLNELSVDLRKMQGMTAPAISSRRLQP